MSMTFTKLFSSLPESTVWGEPDAIRIVWITMLAMADKHGRVWASIPGLANRARVPIEEAEKAIVRFLAPDQYSRTKDFDGRRIEVVEGGWKLLNYAKYRAIRDEETIKESKRKYINTRRALEKLKNTSTTSTVDQCRYNAEAEAEAEAKEIKIKKRLFNGDKSKNISTSQNQIEKETLNPTSLRCRDSILPTHLQGDIQPNPENLEKVREVLQVLDQDEDDHP